MIEMHNGNNLQNPTYFNFIYKNYYFSCYLDYFAGIFWEMIQCSHHKHARVKGLTLIEVTLVTAVLLGLVSVLFLGASAYKEGSNRALCIQNIYRVQTAMRVACNYHELVPGTAYSGLKEKVVGLGLYIPEEPVCPSNGTYTYLEGEIPATGETFLRCTVAGHIPRSSVGW